MVGDGQPGIIATRHDRSTVADGNPRLALRILADFEWAIDDQPAKILKAADTFYEPAGCLQRRPELAIIRAGDGVGSWVHIEDTAVATVTALTGRPGVYHVV